MYRRTDAEMPAAAASTDEHHTERLLSDSGIEKNSRGDRRIIEDERR
jgi:hypothetical protein